MKRPRRARRRRNQAPSLLLSPAATAAPSEELEGSPEQPEPPEPSDISDSSESPEELEESPEPPEPSDNSDSSESPEEPSLEALLEERERIGYLRGRAEAVKAAWLDPADPSPESLEALAKMGLSLDGSSPFAGRKSVWNSSY